MSLDSGTSRPLYLQLRDKLLNMIREGVYAPHERLPSERKLAKRFDVSRLTVRQALSSLMHQGIVYTRIGKGTYVSDPEARRKGSIFSFSERVLQDDQIPSSEVLDRRIIPASEEQARYLQISPGDNLVYVARLRKANGVPIVVQEAYLPHSLCPGILQQIDDQTSLYSFLEERYGMKVDSADVRLKASLADDIEAERLVLTKPAAVLLREQVTFLEDGRPIEFSRATYRGDGYEFYTHIHREFVAGAGENLREPFGGGRNTKRVA
ncbi:MAG TPA: GntR family transcriptional regulator [Anaerolineae bacterium]|nr:GntR family transcriptional regulator [Anaerolineae bacterium]